MAGRLPFGIFGQGTDELIAGLEVTIKRDSDNAVVARTHNPGGGEQQIEDNNDGMYYVDDLPTDTYSVFVGSDLVPQDELSHIFHPGDEIKTHINDASKHRIINDAGSEATDLWSAQKIVQELSSKASASHTHAGVYATAGHNHDADYLGLAEAFATTPLAQGQDVINFLVQTANFSMDVSDGYRLKLNQSFSDESILTSNASLCNNMEALQSAILNQITDILQINPRAYHLDAVLANEGKVYYLKNTVAASPKSYGVYMIMAHPDGGYSQVEIAKLSETAQ